MKNTDLKFGFSMPESLLHFSVKSPDKTPALQGADRLAGANVLNAEHRYRGFAFRFLLLLFSPSPFDFFLACFVLIQHPPTAQHEKDLRILRRQNINIARRFFTFR